jgi:hypothetical protein
VWSFEGSPTGYGTHADYMFGWRGDALQKAMDKSECFYDGCGSIKKQQMSVASRCTVKDFVGEQTDGCKLRDCGVGFCVMVLTYDRAEAVAGYGDGVGGDVGLGGMELCEGTLVFLPRSFSLSSARNAVLVVLGLHIVDSSSIHLLNRPQTCAASSCSLTYVIVVVCSSCDGSQPLAL